MCVRVSPARCHHAAFGAMYRSEQVLLVGWARGVCAVNLGDLYELVLRST